MGSLKDSFMANIYAAGFSAENEDHVKTVLELGSFVALGASIVVHAYDQLVAAKSNSDRKYWAEEIVRIQSDIKELLEMSGRGVAHLEGNNALDAYAELANHTGPVN
jgi:hypothetical protein